MASDQLLAMVKQLGMLDKRGLLLAAVVLLNQICSPVRKHTATSCVKDTRIAVVSLLRTRRKKVLTATSTAGIEPGDRIFLFLGHEIGFVFDKSSPPGGSHVPKTIVLAADLGSKNPDIRTCRVASFYTLQNESELTGAKVMLQINLNPSQILALVTAILGTPKKDRVVPGKHGGYAQASLGDGGTL